jgi:hypothetical protein
MKISNCCGAKAVYIEVDGNCICSECQEHAVAEEENKPFVDFEDLPKVFKAGKFKRERSDACGNHK